MARDVFVDTAGLYALADRKDAAHHAAATATRSLLDAGGRLILTDYIIDEAATLAKVRAGRHAAVKLLDLVEHSAGFSMEWIGPARFAEAKRFFRQHADHGYSFTDCTSFVTLRNLRLRDVLTTDRHFAEAGFTLLLPIA